MEDSQDELASLCAAEYPRLVGLLMMQVGDRFVAEELAQDTLLAFCHQWPAVTYPSAWLTRVAINRSRSWMRRRVAERRAYRRHGLDPETVEDRDLHHSEADELRRAVAALPRRQRVAIALRFYECYSVAETASVMGCAEGTVKALTHHGVASLRSRLGASVRENRHG